MYAVEAVEVLLLLNLEEKPLKVVLTNFSEGQSIELQGPWHAQNEALGKRTLPFGRELYIERADFELEPPKKYKRLSPGAMVRLRYAFIIRCDEVVYGDDGEIAQLNCTYFEDSRSGQDTSGLKPKGVVHWVDASAGVPVQVRDYQRLFKVPNPGGDTLLDDINPDSVTLLNAKVTFAKIRRCRMCLTKQSACERASRFL